MSTAKELKELAKQMGIKYSSRMSKKELYRRLGIDPPQKPTRITLENTTTGEVLRFPSIYRVSKDMSINPGLISFYIGKDIGVRVGGVRYIVRRH